MIKEASGSTFDPATGSTYTGTTNNALDLPVREIANWLEEIGANLLIAGNTFDKVYPWDRISDSFSLPLPVPENVIDKLKNIGNIVYILAGTVGNIYQTQGTYVRHFKKIPEYISNNAGTILSNPVTWGGIAQKTAVSCSGVGNTDIGKQRCVSPLPRRAPHHGQYALDWLRQSDCALRTQRPLQHRIRKRRR